MTYPTGREGVTAHVAAEPDEAGNQRCARCNQLLHHGRTGAEPPWAPGQAVGVTDTATVRMSLRPGHDYPECRARMAAGKDDDDEREEPGSQAVQ